MTADKNSDTPDPFNSPSILLAILFSARRTRDAAVEKLTRNRLSKLGIDVMFGDEVPAAEKAKGDRHVR